LAARVAIDTGITVSIGLSTNKFLAKIASDLHKRRGFAVLGGNAAAQTSELHLVHGGGDAGAVDAR
jgi:nucleotidyltransferase/DNA polymerase involved in DNA repair